MVSGPKVWRAVRWPTRLQNLGKVQKVGLNLAVRVHLLIQPRNGRESPNRSYYAQTTSRPSAQVRAHLPREATIFDFHGWEHPLHFYHRIAIDCHSRRRAVQ
jgi:hypothetical protein